MAQHGATHPPGYSDATCYLFDLSNNTGTHLSPAERSLNGTFSTELYAAGDQQQACQRLFPRAHF